MHRFSAFSSTPAIQRDTKLLNWELHCAGGHGPPLAPGEPATERDSFGEVVRVERWRKAILWLELTP